MGRRNHFALGLKRFVLKILCTVLGIILAVLVAGTAIVQSGMEQIQRVDPGEAQPLSREELAEFLASETEPVSPDLPTLDPALVNFAAADKPIGGKHSPVINILLIGQDRRPGETRARSDSMILCTVNKETGTLILTSILRDLYVQIPGYGDNRINAAYAAGGMQLLNETLELNFGVHVACLWRMGRGPALHGVCGMSAHEIRHQQLPSQASRTDWRTQPCDGWPKQHRHPSALCFPSVK